MKFLVYAFSLTILFLSFPANASSYSCVVKQKFNGEHVYSSEEIEAGKFSVKIDDGVHKNSTEKPVLSRCSYSNIENKITCDDYTADHVEVTKTLDNRVFKKFYVFSSQFDVQLFPNLDFLENNGRGNIAYGTCQSDD